MKSGVFFACVLMAIIVTAHAEKYRLKLVSSASISDAVDGVANSAFLSYDVSSQRVFVANPQKNRVDIFDLSDPANPKSLPSLSSSVFGSLKIAGLDTHSGLLAVSLANPTNAAANGELRVFSTFDLKALLQTNVGASPSQVVFSRTGTRLVVLNQGLPAANYAVDPIGSIQLFSLGDFIEFNLANVQLVPESLKSVTLNFTDWKRSSFKNSDNVWLIGPNSSVAQDMTPSFFTFDDVARERKAFVSFEWNNAIAEISLERGAEKISAAWGLNYNDFSDDENMVDATATDGRINIARWPVKGVPGAYGLGHFFKLQHGKEKLRDYANHRSFLVVANSGKPRQFTGYDQTTTVGSVTLDPSSFKNANTTIQSVKNGITDLVISKVLSDGSSAAESKGYQELYAFGSRSISIWDTASRSQIWNSGSLIEQKVSNLNSHDFNSLSSVSGSFDLASPRSGPRPLNVITTRLNSHWFAVVSLNQQGGLMLFGITDEKKPVFLDYLNDRKFDADSLEDARSLAPSDLKYVDGTHISTGQNLLLVSNSGTGSLTVAEIIDYDADTA